MTKRRGGGDWARRDCAARARVTTVSNTRITASRSRGPPPRPWNRIHASGESHAFDASDPVDRPRPVGGGGRGRADQSRAGRPGGGQRKGPDRRPSLPCRGGGGDPRRRLRARGDEPAGPQARGPGHPRDRRGRPERHPRTRRQPRPRPGGGRERVEGGVSRPPLRSGDPGLDPGAGRVRSGRPMALESPCVPDSGARAAVPHSRGAGCRRPSAPRGHRRRLRPHGQHRGPRGGGDRPVYARA
jgi:hypothetical protein